jgi:glycosyltransferase involved in cell wall biosynthesis
MLPKDKVLIICPGLGHVNRGYESFTEECFNTLQDNLLFQFISIKGKGKMSADNKTAFCLKRNSAFTKFISKIIKIEPYLIEQFTFFISLIPYLIYYRPKVIFYSDFNLGTFLWHLRKHVKFKYKLLYSNGAPNGPPFTRMDHIQQHLPVHHQNAVDGGTSNEMQTLIPYGINFPEIRLTTFSQEVSATKNKFNIPIDKKIILSAGAINKGHKRMDYLINEVAMLSDDYFLIILGQQTIDTPSIEELATNLLGNRCLIKSVGSNEMSAYYALADIFVLASLSEGLPRVLPEAMSFGLPCFVHDYAVTRETLQGYGFYCDATKSGALSNAIANYYEDPQSFDKQALKNYAYNKFAWKNLKDGYLSMINSLLN